MAETNLHIKITKDDSALKELLEQLAKVSSTMGGATSEKVKKEFAGVVDAAKKAATETTKVKQEAAQKDTSVLEQAEKRRNEILDRAVEHEKRAEKQGTEELITDIVKLQQKRGIAIEARKQAALDGEKAEVKSQAAVIAKYDEELSVLKKIAMQRHEVQKEGAGAPAGLMGTGREMNKGSHKEGLNVGEIVGIGAAVEGLNVLVEKSKEYADAQHQLQAGTGLAGKALEEAGKQAEEMGDKLGVTGEKAKETMGKVAGITHATGEELKKQTEAAIAYEQATGRDASRMLRTEKGKEEIMVNAANNIAKAQQAANNPAIQAQLIQAKLMSTVGELASVLLGTLSPILKALNPIITEVGEIVQSVMKPALDSIVPIVALIGDGIKDFLPVLQDLIQNGFAIISPIITNLGDIFKQLMPIVMQVVKGLGDSLSPIMKALAPIVNELAGVIRDVLTAVIGGGLLPILTDILVPVLRDLVAPILLSLMPIIKALADILQAILVPAVQLLSGILKIIVTDAIAPLIKWLTGVLRSAIDDTVGYITKAIEAITKVVGAITSFLGLGSDAKAATRKAGAEAVQGVQEGINSVPPPEIPAPKEKKGKAGKSKEEIAKEQADALLARKKDELALLDEAEKKNRDDELNLEIEHAQKILTLYKKGTDEYVHANAELHALLKKQNENAKADEAEAFKANQGEQEDSMVQAQQEFLAKQAAMEKEAAGIREQLRVQAIKDASEKAIAEETDRYADELEKRKDDIYNGDGSLNALGEALEANHQGKLAAITQQGVDKQKEIQQQQVAYMLGPFSQAFAKTTDKITGEMDKSIAKSIGQKTMFGQMAGEIVSGYAKMATQAVLTGNTQMLVDSAVATGKAALAAVSAVASAFETIPFPLDIVAAGAALAGVVTLVSKAKTIKLAEGGILTQPTFARGYEAGEAGHEAVIPLGSGRAQDALGIKELSGKIDQSNALMAKQNEHLSAIREAGTRRAPFSPSSMYNVQGGINKALAIVNRRVMG